VRIAQRRRRPCSSRQSSRDSPARPAACRADSGGRRGRGSDRRCRSHSSSSRRGDDARRGGRGHAVGVDVRHDVVPHFRSAAARIRSRCR
jgi:hypothetical protein